MSLKIVIVAIEIGTTYSSFAFTFHDFGKDPTKISLNSPWVAGACNLMTYKTPTCVLIKPDGLTFDAFGYEAENKYSELAIDGDHTKWYFFKRFTRNVYDNLEVEYESHLLEELSGKHLPAKTVFALTIRYLKENFMDLFAKRITPITVEDVHWVLTLPDICNISCKTFMKEAAEAAGIQTQNLTIVSEPLAASVFCRYLPPEKFIGRDKTSLAELKTGTKYIVIDAGGTSVKFIVHQILSVNKVKELLSSDIDCGGSSVDEEYENFIGDIFGKAVSSSLKDRFKEKKLDLFRDFESKKRWYRCNGKNKNILLTIPKTFKESKRGNNNEESVTVEKSRYKNSVIVSVDKLRIDDQVMRSFFEKVVTDIIRHVESLLKKPIASDCSAIVMVGGFSESAVLQECIEEKFSGLKILIPEEAGVAVLKGAVILGHNPLALDVKRTASKPNISVTNPYTAQDGMSRKYRASEQRGPVKVPALAPRDKMNRQPKVSMKSLNVTSADLPCYKMDRKPRGWCIIINVENFVNDNARTGTQHDKVKYSYSVCENELRSKCQQHKR